MKQALTKNAVLIKVGLYVALTLCAGLAGRRFYHHYAQLMDSSVVEDATDRVGGRIASQTRFSQIVIFGGAFFVSVVGLGLMVGHDVSHLVAERFGRVMYNDEGEALKKTGYEEAEELWANGNALDAIQKMRDYLKANPREQHVAIRIAEIYEKDLQNPLAAALEYEELLKQKLQPEQWAWTAIHLCNLYNGKLSQPDKANVLLRRIVDEYGETSAAEKARKRLGIDNEEEDAAAPPPTAEPARPKPPVRVINEGLQAHLKKLHGSGQNET